ncbi:kinetochore protein SPC25 homolog [Andrographis paniculata]|uniref:kinetochore protein SPC25 homolog n=1 Tax=Andrographis paniculata TaxID=175694 RepID=UPI0021E9533A|nr:kinetochore protein SPC25 homolog [Andrographis paniculata]
MEGAGESSTLTRMAQMRLACEREMPIQKHGLDSLDDSYQNNFDSAKSQARRTVLLQGKLEQVKGELKEAEDALVKSLAVKSRKEAMQMALMESISITKAKVDKLKKNVQDQKERKDGYAAILSQHSEALTTSEKQCSQNKQHQEQIEEAISWYNKVLGFRVESGRGVKFIFTNINCEKLDEEYSFTLRHENEIYTLIKCDPHLNDTKELIKDLNKTNGLFKFVRTMREKFLEAAAHGTSLCELSINQDFSTISSSGLVASYSTEQTYESPIVNKGVQISKSSSNIKKDRKGNKILSSRSPYSLRESARSKVRK